MLNVTINCVERNSFNLEILSPFLKEKIHFYVFVWIKIYNMGIITGTRLLTLVIIILFSGDTESRATTSKQQFAVISLCHKK